jgi:hypothetical protein
MKYDHKAESARVLRIDGVQDLFRMSNLARKLIERSGAVRGDKLLSCPGLTRDDSFYRLALLETLVDCGQLKLVYGSPMTQHRIFAEGAIMLDAQD